ncbi:serine hydrolase [Streptococcus catagoni]|uniref:serine hydrolase n=1 Tax=Streptococcus catagoni TaxID=2654874 RepID=UPI001A9FF578|nr:serine hydrolase [Streptococcus catagoni]
MTKKRIFLFLLFFLFIPFSIVHAEEAEDILTITRKAGFQVNDINKPKASIVVDAGNGDILWQDNSDAVRDPASMSKMFTLYLLFEDLKSGKVSLNTKVKATETDQAISKIYEISNNNIVAGVDYPISDLITMTAVPSSNAATIMIANYLSNNNASAFIDRINDKAKELGMTHTHFYNASGAAAQAFKGLYNPESYDKTAPNQTTARDLAKLIYSFLKKYPKILSYTNKSLVKTMVGTPYQEEFHSYNYSLPGDKFGLKGVDGLKTGSSPSGAFNAMVTAQRNGKRLITIVMGVGDWSDQDGEFYRHPFVNALTEKGFADLSKENKKKYPNLFGKKKTSEKPTLSAKKYQTKKPKTILHKIEAFVDYYHNLIFVCLAVFIVLVLLLMFFAIAH